MYQAKVKGLLTFLCICTPMVGWCLDEDKQKTMHVQSDFADLNQKQHIGTYVGNVEFTQGTTNLIAEKAITKANTTNQLSFAIATGSKAKQAHYWTITDPKKPPLHAYADTIKYYPLKHLIVLIGHARIEQGQNSLSAMKITVDTLNQHLSSYSDSSTRTKIVLYPEKKP